MALPRYVWYISVLLTLFTGPTHGKVSRKVDFVRQPLLDDKICSSNNRLQYDKIETLMQCMSVCVNDGKCRGTVFIPGSSKCNGCTTLESMDDAPGAVVYKKDSSCLDEPSTALAKLLEIPKPRDLRCIRKIISVKNEAKDGEWHKPRFCPSGSYATGYSMKLEPDQGLHDDSGVNALNLKCRHADGSTGGIVRSDEGRFGTWTETKDCNRNSGPVVLKAFQLQVKEPSINFVFVVSDKEGVTFVRFRCGFKDNNTITERLELPPGSSEKGDYGPWSTSCDPGQGVCGLTVKLDKGVLFNPLYDDSSVTDVVMYCC